MSDDTDANLDRFYGNLRHYVRMVTGGYSNLLMLDAKGGLGKTHNVVSVLESEYEDDSMWIHQSGFTTPVELFKTLYRARHEECTLFLDDMSGVTNNQKAIDMLKAATDTQGSENVVEYRTSQDIEHPSIAGLTVPNSFTFRGSIIMSFNDTPDNHHFDALKDRGTFYQLSFNYQERLDLIQEIAEIPDFSELTVSQQVETAEWIETVTNPAFDVTIRSFEEVCQIRHYAENEGADWQEMALEVFDLDYEKYLVLDMRLNSEMEPMQQVEAFMEATGRSQSHYYDVKDAIADEYDLH